MNFIERIQRSEFMINEKLKKDNILVRVFKDKQANKGKIIIRRDKVIERIFKIELVAYRQINIIENNKIIADGLHIDNLGKWLYNLYNSVEYLYVFYGGEQTGKILTREQIDKISSGVTDNIQKARNEELTANKKESNNQPIVKGYLGPIFEKIDYGKIYLRYETQEIYNMLSV